jgi:IS30 family transposase
MIRTAEYLLNIRPRKTMEFLSPLEVFLGPVAFGT